MNMVFPAGKSKVSWVSSPEEIEAKLQKQASASKGEVVAEDAGIEADPQFDAIKDLPCVADEAAKLEDEIAGDFKGVAQEGEIAGDVKGVAQEVKEVVEEAVEKATEAVQEVVEKVEVIVEKAEEKKEDKTEVAEEPKKDDKKEDKVEVEIAEEPKADEKKGDDEVVLEIALEPEEEIPGGTVGFDGKESKEGCMAAAKPATKVEAKAEPKVEAKAEAKPEIKVESKKVSADDTSKFVKISKLSPDNKKELRDFWSTVFPAEYVDSMLKEY